MELRTRDCTLCAVYTRPVYIYICIYEGIGKEGCGLVANVVVLYCTRLCELGGGSCFFLSILLIGEREGRAMNDTCLLPGIK